MTPGARVSAETARGASPSTQRPIGAAVERVIGYAVDAERAGRSSAQRSCSLRTLCADGARRARQEVARSERRRYEGSFMFMSRRSVCSVCTAPIGRSAIDCAVHMRIDRLCHRPAPMGRPCLGRASSAFGAPKNLLHLPAACCDFVGCSLFPSPCRCSFVL